MFTAIAAFLAKTLLPALVPSVVDGASALIAKVTGESPTPHTVAELIQLQQADTERLKAIAAMTTPVGQISRWVANLQVASHYIASILVLVYGCAVELIAIWAVVPADVAVLAGECVYVGTFVLVGLGVRDARAAAK